MTETTIEPQKGSHQGDLVLSGLSLRYRSVTALREVDLVVPRGSVVALLGANGAGKTSLLRAVSGNLAVHSGVASGSVQWDGSERLGHSTASIVRSGVAQVPEGRRVFAGMTVHENLLTGRQGAAGRTSVDRAYELFPVLAERRRQRAGLLSGGEQQMLAIGRALMAQPRLLMLDEPSLGLAPKMVAAIMQIVREINHSGTSVLLIEQNAALALEVADSVAVLELGRVVLSGPTADPDLLAGIRSSYLRTDALDGAVARIARSSLAPWKS